ncbi:MAG: glycosyltransferase family 39 protein [Candidatus Omnitrophica bacterium]|nr:glycosyltransferase family 39 protein [Candidatus Omnitrophota bacterium]
MPINKDLKQILTLLLLSALLFIVGNQVVSLTNPDEVFYAGTAKEMAEKNTWLVPYLFGQPQFEKPILGYWLIRAAFLVFGTTAFAARFFPAFFALLGVLGVYLLCARVFNDRKKAFWCAFVLMSGALYIGLARTVFIDMIFSVLIGFALGAFYLGYHERRWKPAGIVLFYVFAALAVLTKGLLGLTMPLGAVLLFLFLRKELGFLWCRASALGAGLFILIAVPWYALMTAQFGRVFIDEFWVNDHIRRLAEAEHAHNDKWYFYPGTILVCAFPWTFFTAASFGLLFRKLKDKASSPFYWFLACWIMAGFAQVQFAHSKLVSYIFPVFPAVAILTGDYLRELFAGSIKKARVMVFVTLAAFLALPFAITEAAFRYSQYLGQPDWPEWYVRANILHLPIERSVLLVILLVMAAFFVIIIVQFRLVSRRIRWFPYAAAFNMAFLFFTVLGFAPYVEDFACSRKAGEYIKAEHPTAERVLCSKMMVRGVRYYSGAEVGVLKLGGGAFFSAHPIPFIASTDKLFGYLQGRTNVLAVLERKDRVDVCDSIKGRYDCVMVKEFGSQSVIKFVPRP